MQDSGCSDAVKIVTAAKLVTMSLVGASAGFLIAKPLLGCIHALEDRVLVSLQLKSFIMEKWIWLRRQSTGCVALFMLLMLYRHIFLSHVKISRDWKMNKNQFTCRLTHLVISSAIKLRLVSTYSSLPQFRGVVWRNTASCISCFENYLLMVSMETVEL